MQEVSGIIHKQSNPTPSQLPTVANAAEVLRSFAQKIKVLEEGEKVQASDLLSKAAFSSTVKVNDEKNKQGTQVMMEPERKHHRSKGVTAKSTYWGTNKGTV